MIIEWSAGFRSYNNLKGLTRQEDAYITMDEMQKQVSPMEKWTKKVGQKFCRSRNIFSERRVITPESNRIGQPEGKQLRKENKVESWGNGK